MTSRDFCYWLQGYFEVADADGQGISMTDSQVKMIQKHLNLVFKHEIDPSMGDELHQEILNAIHNETKPTLADLGKQHNFEVIESQWGSPPGPGYKLSPLHGWYKESEGIPRC